MSQSNEQVDPTQRRNTKPVWISLAIVFVPLLAILAFLYWESRRVPISDAAEISWVEIEIDTLATPGVEIRIRSEDRSAIEKLAAVLSKSKKTNDHKCRSLGRIKIRTHSGKQQELRILPGHEAKYYEYRFKGAINRVERESFFNAMKALGIKKLPHDNSEEMVPL